MTPHCDQDEHLGHESHVGGVSDILESIHLRRHPPPWLNRPIAALFTAGSDRPNRQATALSVTVAGRAR
jgi:hypothetical protein